MNSKDILEDLIRSIETEKSKPEQRIVKSQPTRRQAPQGKFVSKSGAGGIIFNFGSSTAGLHPAFQTYEKLLNQHSDPTQVQVAQYQQNSFKKALDNYVTMGEHGFANHVRNEEAMTSMKDEEAYSNAKVEFAKSSIKVGREIVEAQSETDAAVLEMFKNGELE